MIKYMAIWHSKIIKNVKTLINNSLRHTCHPWNKTKTSGSNIYNPFDLLTTNLHYTESLYFLLLKQYYITWTGVFSFFKDFFLRYPSLWFSQDFTCRRPQTTMTWCIGGKVSMIDTLSVLAILTPDYKTMSLIFWGCWRITHVLR